MRCFLVNFAIRGILAVFICGLGLSGPDAVCAQTSAPEALAAAPIERVWMSFDARILTEEEKRLVQIGLAASGHYVGVIDGAWGRRSQEALEAYGRSNDSDWADEALFWHAIALTEWTKSLLDAAELSYRSFPAYGLQMIAPSGRLVIDPEDGRIARLQGPGLTIVLSRQDSYLATGLHDAMVREHAMTTAPYTVRRDDRLVTSVETSSQRYYARSERTGPGDVWSSAFVIHEKDVLDPLFSIVVASIAPGSGARAGITSGSPFALSYRELTTAVARTREQEQQAAARPAQPTPTVPQPGNTPAAPDAGQVFGTGTAFYVNNVDLVTAAHVVDECRSVSFLDGSPIRIVAIHPLLDLALLTSDRRSRVWLSVDRTGEGRLGQKVYALGYPYFGITTTSLNVTAGNVSATRGLADSDSEITISAPVQPGNSGGPLLDSRGAIIGIVIAKLSASAMLEAAQSLPENVNFAVRGAELIAFLDANGVLYPRSDGAGFDVEDGIPQTVQDAIVPIVCR